MFALSPSQTRILLAELKYEGTEAYHLYSRICFPAEDEAWVKAAIPYVFSGNFSLRVTRSRDGGFMQYSCNEPAVFEESDAAGFSDEETEKLIASFREKGISPLFDGPLYRLYLIKGKTEICLFAVIHHLISDGTTLSSVLPALFDRVITALKSGKPVSMRKENYHIYIDRLKEHLSSDEAARDCAYWTEKLSGYRGVSFRYKSLKKGTIDRTLPKETTDRLLKMQNENRISSFVTGLGSAFLYWAGSKWKLGSSVCEMVWEISISGRYFGDDLLSETGMFVETIPLRLTYDPDRSYAESLKYVKAVMKEGLQHGKTDTNAYFPELQKEGVDPAALTSFSAVSNSVSDGSESVNGPVKRAELGFPEKETDVPFHIRINSGLSDEKGLQSIKLEYNRSVFSQSDAEEIIDGILDLIEQAAANEACCVGNLDFAKSSFIESEVIIEKNICAADDAVFLQSGMNNAGRGSSRRHIGKKIIDADRENFAAAFLTAIVRFGMTRDVLIGIANGKDIFPFGIHIDTSMPVCDFAAVVAEKTKECIMAGRYPIRSRADIDFHPSVVLSLRSPVPIDGDILISAGIDKDETVICFDEDRYSREYMEAFCNCIAQVSRALTGHEPLKDTAVYSGKTGEHSVELKNEGTVNAVFERMARAYPDREILKACDASLTYRELDERACRLGKAIIARGIRPQECVLVLMRRTSALVVAVFGVIKAGAVLITLDPNYPKDRIEQIIEDSEAPLVITDIPEIAGGLKGAELFDSLMEKPEAAESCPNVPVTPDSSCFIIYTSGTTGRPKGVVLTHKGITNYIAPEPENAPIYALKERCSRMLCLSSVSFIVFFREIFGTILNGIPVVLCSDVQSMDPIKISELITENNIDAFGSTPTRLLSYCEVKKFRKALSGIHVMIIGGEGFPGRLFPLLRKYSACEIYNSYGPTEVTIASHQKLMESPRVSAGFPMLNVWDRISDIDGNELPPYAVGELYVGGAGVAKGYLNNDKLTEEHFPVIGSERWCNTGDLAYKDKTGEVFVLGRNDGMIKLRGLRIELEEVENAIGTYPGISHVRVVVRNLNGTEHLCAFYTLQSGIKEIPDEKLKEFIGKKLPAYMVPSYYVPLKQFPLTPNGKVAVKSLKEIPVDVSKEISYEAPETEEEKLLYKLAADVLGTDRFGIKDDLFTIGLTSLTMVSIISGIYEHSGAVVSVAEFMKNHTVAELAELLKTRISEPGEAENQAGNEKTDAREYYPLTESQLGIYLECEADPEGIGYHLPNYIRFDKTVDPMRLKNAVLRMIANHPYLKTTIAMDGGKTVQKKNTRIHLGDAVTVEDIPEFTEEKALELTAEPFDLNGGLLFRIRIFRTEKDVVLFTVFHHLIVDGGSLNILFRDIAAAYDGLPMSEEKMDGYALSMEENSNQHGPAFSKAKEFFAQQMKIADEPTILTPNLNSNEEKGRFAVRRVYMKPEAIDSFCDRLKISRNVLFMSAVSVVLTKFISDNKLLMATVSNGRSDPRYEATAALLVKTLPLCLKPDRTMSVMDLFGYVSDIWMQTMSSQSYTFTRLAADYDIHPEFYYTYHGRIYEEIHLQGKKYRRSRVPFDSLRCKFMLNVLLEAEPDSDSLAYIIQADYNDALYSADYVSTFIGCIQQVIEQWTKKGDAESLSRIRVCDTALSPSEKPYGFKPLPEIMINQAVEAAVAADPDKEILIVNGEHMTYDQLNRRANRIANALRRRGVKEGGSIVLMLERTCNLVAAILGTIKAGAAYIPMDTDYPEDRVAYVMADAGADFIISSQNIPGSVTVEELLEETDESNPPCIVDPERLCYMIYTSGSSGRPKGVEVTHRNIWNLCQAVPENVYYHGRKDKPGSVLNTGTISFDISVLDIIGSLINGIKVILANSEENKDIAKMVALIKETRPEAFGLITPSRMQQYLMVPAFAEAIKVCRMCSLGGEVLIPSLYFKLRKLRPDMDIYHCYGPTETTVFCNARLMQEENIMSVGRALYNVTCDIRDIDGKVLPAGVIGELYIGGYGVSKGYHNLPEKTAESFVMVDSRRCFKSGDFAYKLPNEEVVIIGRRDGQIKLRGLRIEIGEIEQAMLSYGPVCEAAVVVKHIGKSDYLCGYFEADEKIDIEALKNYLASRLTPYMVPSLFTQLEKMPYTISGKMDRKNLPEPVIIRNYDAPCSEVEDFFCSVFEQVLELERVGATDDFFEIGGSSLMATQLTVLASNGGYQIRYRDVFDHTTPRALAQFVAGHGSRNASDTKIQEDIENYDYSSIHEFLKKNTFENYLKSGRREMHTVFLTGATGFLGIHVLRELLEMNNVTVHCMLRGYKNLSAAARLKDLLFYYFEHDYSELEGTRLFVREGVITELHDFSIFDDEGIDTVINCAASVKHFSAGTDIYEANVTGVKNGLEYARQHGCRFIQISTASTGGEILLDGKHEDFIYDERVLYKGQILDNQYLSSKFLAERMVLQAAADGFDAKVMRVGNLMARDSDGIFQANFNSNGFISRLKAYATVGMMSYDTMLRPVEMSPIDITAKAILKLATAPQECALFNCYNNHRIFMGDLVARARLNGIEIESVPQEVFDRSLKEAEQDENKQKGVYGLVTTVGMGMRKERRMIETDNTYTTRVLYHENLFWPVISEKYMDSFFDFLIGMDFFDVSKYGQK